MVSLEELRLFVYAIVGFHGLKRVAFSLKFSFK